MEPARGAVAMRRLPPCKGAHQWGLRALLFATGLGVFLCIGGGLSDGDRIRKALLLAGLIAFTLGALAAGGLCLLHWTSLADREPFLVDDTPMRDPDEIMFAWCGCVLLVVVGLFTALAVLVAQTPAESL